MSNARTNERYRAPVLHTTIYDAEARALCFLASLGQAGDRATTAHELAALVGLRIEHTRANAAELFGGDASVDVAGRTIYVRAGLAPALERWAILHELGHYDARNLGLDYATEERHADRFAGTVLYWLGYASIDSPRL